MTYLKSNSLRTLTHWQNAKKKKIITSTEIRDLILNGIQFSYYAPSGNPNDGDDDNYYYVGPWLVPPDMTDTLTIPYNYTTGLVTGTREMTGCKITCSPGDGSIYNRYNTVDGYVYHWWIQSVNTYTMTYRGLTPSGDGPFVLDMYPGTISHREINISGGKLNIILPIMHRYYICGGYWTDSDDVSGLPEYMTDLDRAALDTNLNSTPDAVGFFNGANYTGAGLTTAAGLTLAAEECLGRVIADSWADEYGLPVFLADITFDGNTTNLYPWGKTVEYDQGQGNFYHPLFGGFSAGAFATSSESVTEADCLSLIEAYSDLGGDYSDVPYISGGYYAGKTGTTETSTLFDGNKIQGGEYCFSQNTRLYSMAATMTSGIRSITQHSNGTTSCSTADQVAVYDAPDSDNRIYLPSFTYKRLTDGACFATVLEICTGYELMEGAQIINV